jgi:hypothetical protein
MQNRIYFEKFLSEDDFQYYLDLVSNEEVMVMNYGRVFTLEETKSIHKVIAITDSNNLVSKKILFNNGFVSCKIFEIDDGSLAEMHSKEIIHF